MATRQYIGARYVTKIYENSLDPSSAEWEASVNYEPLTMVTYNNGSYLSKKQVPGTVGDPASNPSYWVQTGFYNGQISYLQNQIDTINGTLTSLDGRLDSTEAVINFVNKFAGKSVVIYGDSLSVANTTWVKPVGDLITSIGGTVTLHTTSNWKTAEALSAAMGDNNVYDFALVWIGINDANTGVTLGRIGAANTFCDNYYKLLQRIRTVSPSCEIYCFGLAFAKPSGLALDINKSLYYYDIAMAGVVLFSGATYKTLLGLPRNNYADNSATTDGTHFSETYSKTTFAWTIINYLMSSTMESGPDLSFKIGNDLGNRFIEMLVPSTDCEVIFYDECYCDKYGVHLTFMLNVHNTIAAATNLLQIVPELLRPETGTIAPCKDSYLYLPANGKLVYAGSMAPGLYPVCIHYRPKYVVSYGLS